MKDEEYVLRQDNRDRAVTARSARNKRTHCGKGGRVKLPSDYMTKKEIKAMSGECKSYRLNEPMHWVEFKKMPDDIKVTYINLIREKYDASDRAIAEMLGVAPSTVLIEFKRIGISHGRRKGRPTWDREGFLAWVHGVPVQAEETPEIVAEDIRVEIPVEPVEEVKKETRLPWIFPESGSMTFEGKTEDVLRTLGVLLGGAKVHIGITWDLLEVEHG